MWKSAYATAIVIQCEYKDFEYEGEDGTTLDLIMEHFSLHVIDGALIEIGDAANKEEGFLVKAGVEIAGRQHAAAPD